MIIFLIVMVTLMMVCGILSAIEDYMAERELRRMSEAAWKDLEREYQKKLHENP